MAHERPHVPHGDERLSGGESERTGFGQRARAKRLRNVSWLTAPHQSRKWSASVRVLEHGRGSAGIAQGSISTTDVCTSTQERAHDCIGCIHPFYLISFNSHSVQPF